MHRTMKMAAAAVMIAAALGATSGKAGAAAATASPCKGLDQTSCKANTSCSWVKAHKIKTGKEIAAFCRRKPERKASQPAAPKG
jgi:hypothetical protein